MPIECSQLEGAPKRLTHCPRCSEQFEPFLRGMVQRSGRKWLVGPKRPYCALICRACKEIVGFEYPAGDEIELCSIPGESLTKTIVKKLRQLFFRVFKRYRRLEVRCETYAVADKLIRSNDGKAERDQWVIAPEEDRNRVIGVVYIERRERITE